MEHRHHHNSGTPSHHTSHASSHHRRHSEHHEHHDRRASIHHEHRPSIQHETRQSFQADNAFVRRSFGSQGRRASWDEGAPPPPPAPIRRSFGSAGMEMETEVYNAPPGTIFRETYDSQRRRSSVPDPPPYYVRRSSFGEGSYPRRSSFGEGYYTRRSSFGEGSYPRRSSFGEGYYARRSSFGEGYAGRRSFGSYGGPIDDDIPVEEHRRQRWFFLWPGGASTQRQQRQSISQQPPPPTPPPPPPPPPKEPSRRPSPIRKILATTSAQVDLETPCPPCPIPVWDKSSPITIKPSEPPPAPPPPPPPRPTPPPETVRMKPEPECPQSTEGAQLLTVKYWDPNECGKEPEEQQFLAINTDKLPKTQVQTLLPMEGGRVVIKPRKKKRPVDVPSECSSQSSACETEKRRRRRSRSPASKSENVEKKENTQTNTNNNTNTNTNTNVTHCIITPMGLNSQFYQWPTQPPPPAPAPPKEPAPPPPAAETPAPQQCPAPPPQPNATQQQQPEQPAPQTCTPVCTPMPSAPAATDKCSNLIYPQPQRGFLEQCEIPLEAWNELYRYPYPPAPQTEVTSTEESKRNEPATTLLSQAVGPSEVWKPASSVKRESKADRRLKKGATSTKLGEPSDTTTATESIYSDMRDVASSNYSKSRAVSRSTKSEIVPTLATNSENLQKESGSGLVSIYTRTATVAASTMDKSLARLSPIIESVSTALLAPTTKNEGVSAATSIKEESIAASIKTKSEVKSSQQDVAAISPKNEGVSAATSIKEESIAASIKTKSEVKSSQQAVAAVSPKNESIATYVGNESAALQDDTVAPQNESLALVSEKESVATSTKPTIVLTSVKNETVSIFSEKESVATSFVPSVKNESALAFNEKESVATSLKQDSTSPFIKDESALAIQEKESIATSTKDQPDKDKGVSTIGSEKGSVSTSTKQDSIAPSIKDESVLTIQEKESIATSTKDQPDQNKGVSTLTLSTDKESVATSTKQESVSPLIKDESALAIQEKGSISTSTKDDHTTKSETISTVNDNESVATSTKQDKVSSSIKDASVFAVQDKGSVSTSTKDAQPTKSESVTTSIETESVSTPNESLTRHTEPEPEKSFKEPIVVEPSSSILLPSEKPWEDSSVSSTAPTASSQPTQLFPRPSDSAVFYPPYAEYKQSEHADEFPEENSGFAPSSEFTDYESSYTDVVQQDKIGSALPTPDQYSSEYQQQPVAEESQEPELYSPFPRRQETWVELSQDAPIEQNAYEDTNNLEQFPYSQEMDSSQTPATNDNPPLPESKPQEGAQPTAPATTPAYSPFPQQICPPPAQQICVPPVQQICYPPVQQICPPIQQICPSPVQQVCPPVTQQNPMDMCSLPPGITFCFIPRACLDMCSTACAAPAPCSPFPQNQAGPTSATPPPSRPPQPGEEGWMETSKVPQQEATTETTSTYSKGSKKRSKSKSKDGKRQQGIR